MSRAAGDPMPTPYPGPPLALQRVRRAFLRVRRGLDRVRSGGPVAGGGRSVELAE